MRYTAKKLYRIGIVIDINHVLQREYGYVGSLRQALPVEIARKIARHPKSYPRSFVFAAGQRCEIEVEHSLESVGNVALKEKWFERT